MNCHARGPPIWTPTRSGLPGMCHTAYPRPTTGLASPADGVPGAAGPVPGDAPAVADAEAVLLLCPPTAPGGSGAAAAADAAEPSAPSARSSAECGSDSGSPVPGPLVPDSDVYGPPAADCRGAAGECCIPGVSQPWGPAPREKCLATIASLTAPKEPRGQTRACSGPNKRRRPLASPSYSGLLAIQFHIVTRHVKSDCGGPGDSWCMCDHVCVRRGGNSAAVVLPWTLPRRLTLDCKGQQTIRSEVRDITMRHTHKAGPKTCAKVRAGVGQSTHFDTPGSFRHPSCDKM